jgi:hypothetical protein
MRFCADILLELDDFLGTSNNALGNILVSLTSTAKLWAAAKP